MINFSDYHKKRSLNFFESDNLVFSEYHKSKSQKFFENNPVISSKQNESAFTQTNQGNDFSGGFTFTPQQEKANNSTDSTDKWKCMACDEYNQQSENQCTNCFSNKPGYTPSFNFFPPPTNNEESTPSSSSNNLFGDNSFNSNTSGSSSTTTPSSNTTNTETPINNSSNTFSTTFTTNFGDTSFSNNFGSDSKKEDSFTFGTPIKQGNDFSGGFTFTPQQEKANNSTDSTDKWKCMACDEYNQQSENQCTNCFSNKPGYTPSFNFFPPPTNNEESTPSSSSNNLFGDNSFNSSSNNILSSELHWVCTICEKLNPPSASQCETCNHHRFDKKENNDPKTPIQIKSTPSKSFSFTPAKWNCKTCETENEGDVCKLCLDPKN